METIGQGNDGDEDTLYLSTVLPETWCCALHMKTTPLMQRGVYAAAILMRYPFCDECIDGFNTTLVANL